MKALGCKKILKGSSLRANKEIRQCKLLYKINNVTFVRDLRAVTGKLVVRFVSKIVVGIGLTEFLVDASPFHHPKA